MKRVIVCGCRDWTDEELFALGMGDAIDSLQTDSEAFGFRRTDLVVVHGACPTGADLLASQWVRRVGLTTEERHPADWALHGRAAGPQRNSRMAALGADLCLAFWDGRSRGTLDMISAATEAGIPVRIVPKEKP